MSAAGTSLAGRAAELRQAFDASFAGALQPSRTDSIDFLGVRAGDAAYALRLAEVTGLYADTAVTPYPDAPASLLGIAAFRSSLFPVYDLSHLLGGPRKPRRRWIVTVRAAPLALAFDELDGHFRSLSGDVNPGTGPEDGRPVREMVRRPDGAVPIVHLPSVLAAIKRHLPARP